MKRFLQTLTIAFIVALFIFLFDSQPSQSTTLRFVQLTDIHYTTKREDTSYKLLSKSKELLLDAIDQINKFKNIDFVMVTGDGIDQPTAESARELVGFLNKLKFPWYFAIGNHDTTTTGKVSKKYLVSLFNKSNRDYNFEKSYYSFKPKKGFKVIVLDGAKDVGFTSNGKISQEQLVWLDSELKSSKRETVLIFLHFPLLEPFPSSHHRILNADEFYEVLNKYKQPIAIFTGHYHTTKITKVNNVVHVSTPALVSYPNAFRLISVTNEKKRAIFDFYFYETRLKEFQDQARLKLIGSSSHLGRESDRATTVIIDK